MVVFRTVDVRRSDPPIDIPPRINVRRMYTRCVDVELCRHALWLHTDKYKVEYCLIVRPVCRILSFS